MTVSQPPRDQQVRRRPQLHADRPDQNHQYVVRVRALQLRYGVLSSSGSSGRTFRKTCLVISQEILNRSVEYNPFPECIMCGRFEEIYLGDDPMILKQLSVATLPPAERFTGLELDGDCSVRFG